jgi:hypothetical protein
MILSKKPDSTTRTTSDSLLNRCVLLQQRKLLGNLAYRRTRPQLNNLGRHETVSEDTYRMLVSTSNPVRVYPVATWSGYAHHPVGAEFRQFWGIGTWVGNHP